MQQDTNTVEVSFPGNISTLWYRADNDKWSVYRGGNKAIIDADINTVYILLISYKNFINFYFSVTIFLQRG